MVSTGSKKELLEFLVRLFYRMEGLPSKLRFELSDALTWYFSEHLQEEEIRGIENRQAQFTIKTGEQVMKASEMLSEDEQTWALAVMLWLKNFAAIQGAFKASEIIDQKINLVSTTLKIDLAETKVTSQLNEWKKRLEKRKSVRAISVPVYSWLLIFDYLLRWGVLWWNPLGEDNAELAQIVFIPFLIISLAVFFRNHLHHRNLAVLKSSGFAASQLRYTISATQYTLTGFFLISGSFIAFLKSTDNFFPTLIALGVYYAILLRFFGVGRLKEDHIYRQEDTRSNFENIGRDDNDEVIVSLETKLNSIVGRLDAYVLESALFGALSFSGFLQIMATDIISFSDLTSFWNNFITLSKAAIALNATEFYSSLALLSDKKSLFCLVSIESLFCSVLFLAVIASRLQFSNFADFVRASLNSAKAYNAKEDAVAEGFLADERVESRLLELTEKVNRKVAETAEAFERLKPIMVFMQYFRNSGIIMFLAILVTSASFVSGALSWLFVITSVAIVGYFNRSRISQIIKYGFLEFRLSAFRISSFAVPVAFALAVIAFLLRVIFQLTESDFLLAGSALLLGGYLAFWLTVKYPVDAVFDHSTPKPSQALARWAFAFTVFAFTGAIAYGLIFSSSSIELHDSIPLSVTLGFALLMLLHTRMWVAGFLHAAIGTFAFSISLMAVLNRFSPKDSFPGSGNTEIYIFNLAVCLVVIFIGWRLPKQVHKLVTPIWSVVLFLTVLIVPPAIKLTKLIETCYHHGTINPEIVSRLNEIASNDTKLDSPEFNEKYLKDVEWHLGQFDSNFGFSYVHNVMLSSSNKCNF
jgi:hypothetical protein